MEGVVSQLSVMAQRQEWAYCRCRSTQWWGPLLESLWWRGCSSREAVMGWQVRDRRCSALPACTPKARVTTCRPTAKPEKSKFYLSTGRGGGWSVALLRDDSRMCFGHMHLVKRSWSGLPSRSLMGCSNVYLCRCIDMAMWITWRCMDAHGMLHRSKCWR